MSDIDLIIYAETLDDQERARIALDNRIRSMLEVGTVDPFWEKLRDATATLENEAKKGLCRALRKHPLGPWVRTTVGIGEKQAGRFLAKVPNPAWHDEEDRPRKVGELWQYCGHGDPARSRLKRGQQCQYNPEAKMRLYMMSEAAVKAGIRKEDGYDDSDGYDLDHRRAITPLGAVYLAVRKAAENKVHTTPCARCGPSGKPAQIGTAWSLGHQHGHALRLVGKEILRDMWIEANRVTNV